MVSSLSCSTTLSLYHAHKGFVLCSQKIRTGPGVVLFRYFGADTSQRVERFGLNQTCERVEEKLDTVQLPPVAPCLTPSSPTSALSIACTFSSYQTFERI